MSGPRRHGLTHVTLSLHRAIFHALGHFVLGDYDLIILWENIVPDMSFDLSPVISRIFFRDG